MPGKHYISDRALALSKIPATEIRPQCETFCSPLLVEVSEDRRIWRCEKCLRYIEAPVSVLHELEWTKPKAREPLPDQLTMYDVLGPEKTTSEN